MSRVGVFICHCGENIARNVDVERAAAEAAALTPQKVLGGTDGWNPVR